MNVEPMVAVEIGTSKVCALVGLPGKDGSVKLIGSGQCQSQGVSKGEILDVVKVSSCIRTALQNAQSSAGCPVIEYVYTP